MAKVSYKEKMEVKNAVSYLENIIAGLKQGSLALNYGEESVDFTPNKDVELEISAEGKERKGKLNIEIAYKNEKPVEEPTVMTIGSKKAEAPIDTKADAAKAGAK